MSKMETTYAGLELKNPIIISSSGLTNAPQRVLSLEKAGAGAVVLKSLFEDQINMLMNQYNEYNEYPEAFDYIRSYSETFSIAEYSRLIKETKELCTIPIIASIHCFSTGSWSHYAKMLEDAGADAIELNISIMNTGRQPINVEEMHVQILKNVRKEIEIPIIVKIGDNFTNLVSVVESLHGNGAAAVVLFNRYYQPDINIIKQTFTAGQVFSKPEDLSNTLRWTAVMTGVLPQIEISTSTGVHDWEAAVKMLLAGATTVQICSAVYQQGEIIISEFITCIEEWMLQNGYESIEDFRGKLNYKNIPNPSTYERTQFMKYFSNMK
ncbi:MAG: dihydroorotate dehydrogenase-like protein [Bacteroidales bacterium]|nr:dihydroorotate dehydrogenase-like protein [Bacteroidales bacterium]